MTDFFDKFIPESDSSVDDATLGGFDNEQEDSNVELSQPLPLTQAAQIGYLKILRSGVILEKNNQPIFKSICENAKPIRSRLSELNIELVIDELRGVAFTRNIDGEDSALPKLIQSKPLSIYDTLLALVLRKHYQGREKVGEQKVVVDIDTIENEMKPFLPLTNNSKTDKKKLNGALNKFKLKNMILEVKGSETRYEISPVIRYVIDSSFLNEMLKKYQEVLKKLDIELPKDSSKTDEDAKQGSISYE